MPGVLATQTRFDQMTLLRTVIGIDLARAVHDSGEGSEKVALGIGIASQAAFAAGSVSDPSLNADFPIRGWLWRGQYRVFGFAADQPAVFNQRIDKDLRGQRKLENGEPFIVVRVTAMEGVSSTLTMLALIRQLWLVT